MRILIYVIILFVIQPMLVHAQANPSKVLNVGDEVPNFVFPKVINYNRSSLRLADMKDKLIILDFWTTFCAPCVASLPKIDTLQRQYSNRVQFLPIDWEEEKRIKNFVSKIQTKKEYVIPFIMDTVVYKSFIDQNNNWLGQYVWIKEGKIIAFTTGEQINKENIELVLAGRILNGSKQKKVGKVLPDFFDRSLLAKRIEGDTNSIKSQSIISSYLNGLQPALSIKTAANGEFGSGIRMINITLGSLYQFAYEIPSYNYVVVESRDSLLIYPSNNRRDSSNLFCYELIMPHVTKKKDLLNEMQNDLLKTFKHQVTIVKRKVTCAVLKRMSKEKLKTTGGAEVYDRNNFYLTLSNQPFSLVKEWIDYYLTSRRIRFVIDETGIDKNVDINIVLSEDMRLNPKSAVDELQKIGIQLVLEEREMNLFVISDLKELAQ